MYNYLRNSNLYKINHICPFIEHKTISLVLCSFLISYLLVYFIEILVIKIDIFPLMFSTYIRIVQFLPLPPLQNSDFRPILPLYTTTECRLLWITCSPTATEYRLLWITISITATEYRLLLYFFLYTATEYRLLWINRLPPLRNIDFQALPLLNTDFKQITKTSFKTYGSTFW